MKGNSHIMKGQELNPGALLQISGSYWETCTLHAGVKLDVFTQIDSHYLSGDTMAEKLGGNERGVNMLLDALTAMGLLEKKDGKYGNTVLASTFLSRHSPRYIGHIIKHHSHLVESWSKLDIAVTSGKPVRVRASLHEEERRKSFLLGMFNLAMNLAPVIVPHIDLSNRRRLIDLGGGPGTYAIHFCQKNPKLKATVFDLATTQPFAEKTIEKFGLTERIDFKAIDYLEENIEGVYDVAWLSHILHGEGPEDCRKIISKAVSALEPGGMILIHEFILNESMDGPLFPALFSLNMLLGTPNGQAYSDKQIADMLAAAGVKDIKRIFFESPNDSGIMVGRV
jgi:predicted O-methyltransferase YrrM